MSESPEDARANASSSSSSNGQVQHSTTAGGDDKATAPIEKTISCVSCRKRKLKCDRIKPTCGTCNRLRHECEYPERRRNLGSKRRNMKELEARLAQVETQLVSESAKNANTNTNTPPKDNAPSTAAAADWNNYPMDINMDFDDDALLDFPIPEPTFTFQPQMPSQIPGGDYFSQDVISLGLQEPLPPDEMIDELHQIYFEKFHYTLPMIHKHRYLAGLHLPPHMRPPICLRYAIWATAAAISEKYVQYDDVLYERARRYSEQAEMKGHGEAFVTVQHAQTWALICTYEARKTYFTRAWMSTGRTVRLCNMLNLHRLDGCHTDAKMILPPPKDEIELEERRRTFWGAFYGDRWASSGTGWPMIIDEKTIMTNLPCSEEAFESGNIPITISLQDALTPLGASQISPFGGVVLSACLFGHNFEHLQSKGPNERPEDLANGEFWKRHRKMDNILSNTFMFLPDHLRLPAGLRDMNIIFLHMNIHASTICLHQAAVVTAERNKITPRFVRQCRARSLMAAEEIANIMRLISHLDSSNMNSWMGFCLYVAAGVFIQDLRSEKQNPQSLANLDFLLSAMRAIGQRHSITNHFTVQVEIDIESSGIKKRPAGFVGKLAGHSEAGHTPMMGIVPPSYREAFASDEVCSYILGKGKSASPFLPKDSTPFSGGYPVNANGLSPDSVYNLTPYGILPVRSAESSSGGSPNTAVINNFGETIPKPNTWATGFVIDQSMQSNEDSEASNTDSRSSSIPVNSDPNRLTPSHAPLEQRNNPSAVDETDADTSTWPHNFASAPPITQNDNIDFTTFEGANAIGVQHENHVTTSSSESRQPAPAPNTFENGEFSSYKNGGAGFCPYVFDPAKSPSRIFLFPQTQDTQYFSQSSEIDLNKTWPSGSNAIESDEFGWTFNANNRNPMPNMPDRRPQDPKSPH